MFVTRMARISTKLRTMLAAPGLTDVYQNVEMPVTPVLVDMELGGVGVNRTLAAHVASELRFRAEWLRSMAWMVTGFSWNLRSWRATADVLFRVMKFSAKECKAVYRRKGEWRYRCNKEVLTRLAQVSSRTLLPGWLDGFDGLPLIAPLHIRLVMTGIS